MAFEFTFPDVGEGISEGTLVTWKIKAGDTIKEDQAIADIETAKALVEVPSPRGGKVLSLHFKEGDTIHVGDVLITIGEDGEKAILAKPARIVAEQKKPTTKKEVLQEKQEVPKETVKHIPKNVTGEILALPAARKKAKELGVDLSSVTGSGKDGLIVVADVAGGSQIVSDHKKPESSIGFDKYGRLMHMPLTGMRKAIAANMVKSVSTIPHVTHIDEADVTALNMLRKKKKEYADNKGVHLTLLPFIIKATLSALKKFPYLNASFDEEKQQIVVKEYYNIGIAVDTSRGLYVPVLHGADGMSIMYMGKKIEVLATHCKQKDIGPKDLAGMSFSITNIGSYGGIAATPIIPPGTVGILGLYRMREKPVVRDGVIVVRKIMPLSITFDHRVVDGGLAAKFMNCVIEHLEDVDLLLVD
jgi:pyruvate dehydrogenase E2 component (dihydrolipoamide acetyltransferase)